MMMRVIRVTGGGDHDEWGRHAAPRKHAKPYIMRPVFSPVSSLCAAFGLALSLSLVAPAAAQENFQLISVTRQNRPVFDGNSNQPTTSFDGRYVGFVSNSPDIFPEPDGQVEFDVYVRDRELRMIERISIAASGGEPNGDSRAPAINADGRYVVFASDASNLVEGDDNGFEDIFLRDRQLGTTERISVGVDDSEADGPSTNPAISGNGNVIVYQSQADNLVPGSDTDTSDIYVYDRTSGETRRVSVGLDGAATNGPSITASISADGNFVTFISAATNLIPDDTSTAPQVFVVDLTSGAIERVSLSSTGAVANRISFFPVLNSDGSLVAFKSEAFNLVPDDTNGVPDVFVRDLEADTTVRVSVDDFGNQSNGLSGPPSISNDGCDVAFPSAATNLVLNDANDHMDVFIVDRCGRNGDQKIYRVGASLGATAPNGDVPDAPPSLTRNGQWLAFASTATDLVPDVTNSGQNVYITGNLLNPPPTEPTPTVTETPTVTPTVECTENDDCPPGQVCDPDTHTCVTPSPTPTPTGCTDNDDCPPGQVCDTTTHMCVTVTPTATVTNTPFGHCTDNDDCPPGQVCDPETNMCVTVTPTVTPTPLGHCTDNDDCPPGQVCDPETNMCVAVTPTVTATPLGHCTDNDDCPPGQICNTDTMMCVPASSGNDGCSCEIHPSRRRESPLTPLALMLPAVVLWLRRRRSNGS